MRRPRRRPLYPNAFERAYRGRLLRRTRAMHDLLRERLDQELLRLGPEIDALAAEEPPPKLPAPQGIDRRADNRGTVLARLLATIRSTARAFGFTFEPSQDDLAEFARGVDKFTTHQVVRVVEQVAAIPPRRPPVGNLLEVWARENVDLIKSIDARYFDDVVKVVVEALEKGRTTKQLTADIQQRFHVSQSRARVIARDQLGKLNGRLTQQRQTGLGVQRYQWSTSNDERVRPEHRALDGKVFSWDAPPSEGHPGTPISCRCVALALMEGEEAA